MMMTAYDEIDDDANEDDDDEDEVQIALIT